MIAFGDLSVDPETANRQEVTGTFYIMHPEYSTLNLSAGHDIALIRFETPVKYTDHVRPICISASTDESNDYQQCRIAGWGKANGMIRRFHPVALVTCMMEKLFLLLVFQSLFWLIEGHKVVFFSMNM